MPRVAGRTGPVAEGSAAPSHRVVTTGRTRDAGEAARL
jgi:hypothetical protein